jgi:hypothetical protein
MSRRRIVLGFLFLVVLGLPACEAASIGPVSDTSYFRASIDGAISSTFEGSGYFIAGVDARRPAAPPMFSLFSEGRGGSANLAFQLFRPGGDLPAVGTYRLGPFVGPTGGEFQANLQITGTRGQTLEMYSASEGLLEITLATPERIEGSFRMSAYRSGGMTGPGTFVGGLRPGPDTPWIDVEGTFAADLARR